MLITGFIGFAIALRLVSLAISLRNEKRMRQAGAVEYGAFTSTVLALAHLAFYLAAIAEGYWRSAPFSAVTVVGLVVYAASMCALFAVISQLGRFWTVKLIVAPGQPVVSKGLFGLMGHPNYFLNILPELVGFALTLHAYATLAVGLPVYAAILFVRIRQEERVMREHFAMDFRSPLRSVVRG